MTRPYLHSFLSCAVTAAMMMFGPAVCAEENASPGLELSGDIAPVHDPAIILDDGGAHIFTTSHLNSDHGLIHWFTSPDLKAWTLRRAVFEDLPQWAKDFNPETRGIWAPDIIKAGDEYRLYYSISSFGKNRSAIGLATSNSLDPETAVWQDRGMVISSVPSDNYNAIDPNILIDDEGHHWMSFGSFWSGIKMIELDAETGKPLQAGPEIYDIATRIDPPNAIEAPFIIERGGWYYLFVSYDFCCRRMDSTYFTVVGRSKKPTGPYVDDEGQSLELGGGLTVLHADLDPTGRFVGPGHSAVLKSGENYFIVYHAYDTQENGIPTLRIQGLQWTEDGWPVAM